MIICRKRNFIVLGVPKTGSTSIMHHILNEIPDEIDICSGRHTLNDLNENYPKIHPVLGAHPNITDFIYYKYLNREELPNMKVYGFIREPVDRFLSIARFIEAKQNSNKSVDLTNNEIAKKYINLFGKVSFLAPQSNWLIYNRKPINRILRYPDFTTLFQEIGISDNLSFHHYNEFRKDKSCDLDHDLRNRILDIYRIDIRILNDFVSC